MKFYTCLFIVLFTCTGLYSFSQKADSTQHIKHFSGSASITNNGISLIPSFSLQKPAVIFLLSLGGQRFSVDPDIRFGLDGKPWTMLFWVRYKLITQSKFRLLTGAHLGLNFRSTEIAINNIPSKNSIARRYLAAELAPNYYFTKNISAGAYYLYSRGLDDGTTKNNHFVTLNANFSHLAFSKEIYLRISPQVFYLFQDGRKGYYTTGLLALAKNNFPLSLSFLVNKRISGNIPGKDLISSFSLIYSFNQKFVPNKNVL
ncbi:MAG TPA: hypothetical protein PKC72_07495 [Chitinophagaceae bacterium]|nr:hypothetical protein [Chitinophagaceae bacterium]